MGNKKSEFVEKNSIPLENCVDFTFKKKYMPT